MSSNSACRPSRASGAVDMLRRQVSLEREAQLPKTENVSHENF